MFRHSLTDDPRLVTKSVLVFCMTPLRQWSIHLPPESATAVWTWIKRQHENQWTAGDGAKYSASSPVSKREGLRRLEEPSRPAVQGSLNRTNFFSSYLFSAKYSWATHTAITPISLPECIKWHNLASFQFQNYSGRICPRTYRGVLGLGPNRFWFAWIN